MTNVECPVYALFIQKGLVIDSADYMLSIFVRKYRRQGSRQYKRGYTAVLRLIFTIALCRICSLEFVRSQLVNLVIIIMYRSVFHIRKYNGGLLHTYVIIIRIDLTEKSVHGGRVVLNLGGRPNKRHTIWH